MPKVDTTRVAQSLGEAADALATLETTDDLTVLATAAEELRVAGASLASEAIDVHLDAALLAACRR